MEDQIRKSHREKNEMQVFIHKGRPHYSYGGAFISCKQYGYYRAQGMTRDEIMFHHATTFEKLFREQEEKQQSRIITENINDLMKYILVECLTKDEKENVKKEYKKEMSEQEKIKLFPEIYQAVLRMYLAHSERKGNVVQREFESLEQTIGSGMKLKETARTQIYNPDAYIE